MESTTIATALTASITTVFVMAFLWRFASTKHAKALADQVDVARQLEKELHLKERDFLAERNQLELANADAIRGARSAAFEEGRLLGMTEKNASHINELTTQRTALVAKFEADRDQTVADARDKLRAEYELQTKLFTVKISPYVSVTEEKGLLRHGFETVTGYQYQLLVNGIPAFAPHVVAEQTEIKKAINPEVEQLLVQAAKLAADGAISLYLGGSPQFAKLAEPIVRRLSK